MKGDPCIFFKEIHLHSLFMAGIKIQFTVTPLKHSRYTQRERERV